MGDPQDGFLFTRASEAPARTLLTPRVHLRPPTEEAVGRRSPQGPCFSPQSLLPPPAFWTRIPGRDPGSSRGGGRNRLLLLGAVRGFPLFFSPHSAQAGSCRVRPQGPGEEPGPQRPLLPRRTRVRGLLPVGGGGAEGMGARRSRAWLAQRPWCGPRRSSQAPSASSVSGARLVAPTRSHSLPPRHSPRQPVVT